jgi:cell fate regulator YaaT (PSP1 superfamily)
MGLANQYGMQGLNLGELKAKIINRFAKQYEIQALRDKQHHEAKAKRICMQKVKEHGLHMEILDAEFQMYIFFAKWVTVADNIAQGQDEGHFLLFR